MVDFNRLKQQRSQITPPDPIEIFMRLPRGSKVNDLWNSQAEALKRWFDHRENKDLIIKLNTGGGKTLVGLLIAQSIINEHKTPALYLSPNNQLVDQTIAMAQEYSIHAVRYTSGLDLDDEFLSGRSIMVATYAALFNGLSRFGIMGGTRDIVHLGGLILDDAHTAFADMRDVFTISIKSSHQPELYAELTHQFRGDFAELGRQGTFDDVVQGKDQAVLEVPYWSWLTKFQEIRQRVSPLASDEFKFEWPLVRDSFHLCHALISNEDFSITPLYPIVDMFPSFSECPRRVYMSATVADDSSIIRTFDASLESVSEPIAPTSLAGVGERMILIPGLMQIPSADLDDLVKALIEWVSKSAGVVILSPSRLSADQWGKVAQIAQGDDVAACVDSLQKRSHNGPFAFPNRYDGIDLPHDSCRLLVFAGLPRGSNSYDLFRATVFEGSSAINTTIAQRVEQGMGRGVRGAGDYCVVLLTGKHLVSWISRTANLNLLSPITRTQLQLGVDVSRNISDHKELKETMLKCLQRDQDWAEYHARILVDAVVSVPHDPLYLAAAAIERKFFKLVQDGYYGKAIAVIEKFVRENNGLDSKMKGWLLQMAARGAYLWNHQPKADQLQRLAYSLNHALLKPKVAPTYVPQLHISRQSENLIRLLSDFELKKGLSAHFEAIADWLVPTASSNQFEEAMKSLGQILGFHAERPEHEYGIGPDVLWIMDDNTALVIEVKSLKKPDHPLNKDEHGQLLESFQWFQNQYQDLRGYKVVVHPNTLTTSAVTATDSFALTLKKLALLVTQVRKLVIELCSLPMPEDSLMSKCEQQLQELKLTSSAIIQEFLEPFHS